MKQKITDILKWFANLGNIAKTIVAVVSLGGIIIGGIKLYNATVIAKHDKEVHEVARDTTINAVLIKINNLSTQVNDISRGQGEILKNQIQTNLSLRHVSDSVNVIRRQLGNHILKTATRDDIRDWMNAFEKKNETSSLAIPYNYNRK